MSFSRGGMSLRICHLLLLCIATFSLATTASAQGKKQKPRRSAPVAAKEAAPALPPDMVAPDVPFDKELTKELGRGTILDQLESKGKWAKGFYAPPEKLLQPYLAGTLGAPVAFEIVSGTQFVSAPAAEAYAQGIVDKLLAQLKGPKIAVKVRVVAEPFYGARATESGMILVRLGTFNADNTKGAATTDELALLLGHELAHILLGHIEGKKSIRTISRMLNYSASALIAYSSVKDSRFVNGKLQGKGDKRMMVQGLVGGLAASTLVQDLLAPSFGRGRELEADRVGVDLARRAGYVVNEGEVLRFVSKHGEDSLRRSRRVEALRFVVNAMMDQVAAKTAKEVGGSGGGLVKDLISFSSKAMSEQIVEVIIRQTKEHPDPEERKAFVARYVRQNYPDAEQGPDGKLLRRDSAGMNAVCRETALAGLLTQVRRAIEVRDILTQTRPAAQDVDQAAQISTALKQAGVTTPRQTAQPAQGKKGAKGPAPPRPSAVSGFGADGAAVTWEMQGMLHAVDGDTGGAQGAWRRGLQSDFASVDMARSLGGTISGAPSQAELDALIARYVKLIGTSDPVLDLVVAAAVTRDDMAAAEVAAARCSTYANGELYPQCAATLGYDPMAKGQSAKTAEGKKAFATKGIEKSFRTMTSLAGIFD